MSYSRHSDGTPRYDPRAPLAICRCGRVRSDDQADTPCPNCGGSEVAFVSYLEAKAEAKGWT